MWSSIEVVITSTTGNRVTVKSRPRVRIPPTPPKQKPRITLVMRGFCFFKPHVQYRKKGDLMWGAKEIILGCFIPFIIGTLMRYASRKWNRPLLATGCLILVFIVLRVVENIISGALFQTFKIEVIMFACLVLGALAADFAYRIRSRQTRD